MIAPGSTIGILGGGQLGRMLALAAAPLGYKCIVYAPEANSTAASVCHAHVRGNWDDLEALGRFRELVDVVTLEFENVPVSALQFLGEQVPVRPGPQLLGMTQDRATEKRALNDLGIATARWCAINDHVELAQARADFGGCLVLKTRRMGYDGKGQIVLGRTDNLSLALESLGHADCIAEELVDFACEVSVIVARSPSGQVETFPVVRNEHENHILRETHFPAGLGTEVAQRAEAMARAIADGMKLEGLLAVEMFVTRTGELLVNELAPRPHNSGHWTIEGCNVSQFEQAIRAACNLPLKRVVPHGPAVMTNILGAEAHDWLKHLYDGHSHLHLYDKGEARSGRKMGHVTQLIGTGDDA